MQYWRIGFRHPTKGLYHHPKHHGSRLCSGMQEHFEFNPSYAMLTLAMSPGEQSSPSPGPWCPCRAAKWPPVPAVVSSRASRKWPSVASLLPEHLHGRPRRGWVSLAPSGPGDIQAYDVSPGRELFIQGGSYLASTMGVETDTKFQGHEGAFSGESAFFIRAFTQQPSGRVYFNSFGAIKAIPVQPGRRSPWTPVTWSPSNPPCSTPSTRSVAQVVRLRWEGLVMNFTGQGTVWIQTRNFSSWSTDHALPPDGSLSGTTASLNRGRRNRSHGWPCTHRVARASDDLRAASGCVGNDDDVTMPAADDLNVMPEVWSAGEWTRVTFRLMRPVRVRAALPAGRDRRLRAKRHRAQPRRG